MAARSIGSVTLSFGLISIPAKIYTAVSSAKEISFNLIDKATGSRVKQQYVRATDGTTVVAREDMVKGYEFAKDQFVTFTNEEIKALDEIGTKAIEVEQVVPFASIDPLYLDSTYYLIPDKAVAKQYALFVEALGENAAIGRWANRGRGHVVAIRSIQGRLAMQVLHFNSDVRDIADYEVPAPASAVKPAELALAKQLIGSLTAGTFDPTAFKDEHQARLQTAIEAKMSGKPMTVEAASNDAEEPADLMAALQASLATTAKAA